MVLAVGSHIIQAARNQRFDISGVERVKCLTGLTLTHKPTGKAPPLSEPPVPVCKACPRYHPAGNISELMMVKGHPTHTPMLPQQLPQSLPPAQAVSPPQLPISTCRDCPEGQGLAPVAPKPHGCLGGGLART